MDFGCFHVVFARASWYFMFSSRMFVTKMGFCRVFVGVRAHIS